MNLHDLDAWVAETSGEEAFRDLWDTSYYDRSPEAQVYRAIVIRGFASLLTGAYDGSGDMSCARQVFAWFFPFRDLHRFELAVTRIHGDEPDEYEQHFGRRADSQPAAVVRWKLLTVLLREERLDWLEKLLRQPFRRVSRAGGRPLDGPDMLIVARMLEDEHDLSVGCFLTPAEREQFEVFLDEPDDKVLAARWGIKEPAVRKRRSRLRTKIGRIIPDLVTTPLYVEGQNEGENDVTNTAVIEAVKAEGEKTRQAIEEAQHETMLLLYAFERDGETPASEWGRYLAERQESTPTTKGTALTQESDEAVPV